MRHFIIASHAHFAAGIYESIQLLLGERADVTTLSMFVDGNDDIASCTRAVVASQPEDTEFIVVTDILGGSVANEFTKILAERPNMHVVANMNLPLLISLLFADPAAPADVIIRDAVASADVMPKYINDLVAAQAEEEDEF